MDWRLWAGVAVVVLGLFTVLSFLRQESSRGRGPTGSEAASRNGRAAMLSGALTVLGELENYHAAVAHKQVVDRLNQWYLSTPSDGGWTLDPLLSSMPKRYQPYLTSMDLGKLHSTISDGVYLEETVLCRDIARTVCGSSTDPLDQARKLFDWTVRELQLEPDLPKDVVVPLRRPGEILMRGSVTVDERAWIFLLLARQRQLDTAVLAVGNPDDPSELKLWTLAVLVEGELYLFDPRLGLPIPVPGGSANDVATLEQAATDPRVLDALDLEPDFTYDVSAADLERVVVWLEVPPQSLSRRMKAIESALTGEQRFIVASNPTTTVGRWQGVSRVARAEIWQWSWEQYRAAALRERDNERLYDVPDFAYLLQLPALRQARLLHFKGMYSEQTSSMNKISANLRYMHSRLPESGIDERVRRASPAEQPLVRASCQWGRRAATYWLGLVAYEAGNLDTATRYFEKRCLGEDADTPWRAGAHYNLARTYELLGKPDLAIKHLRAEKSAQRHGNLLRAKWLEASAPATDGGSAVESPANDEPPPETTNEGATNE